MPARWRVALAAVVAAAIVGGVLPHGVLSGARAGTTEVVQAAEAPFGAVPTCLDATCGKGGPAAPTPAPMVALAGVLSALALAAMAVACLRRRRPQVVPLPAGATDPPFHPPQFS